VLQLREGVDGPAADVGAVEPAEARGLDAEDDVLLDAEVSSTLRCGARESSW
jgi:hypothetical protein